MSNMVAEPFAVRPLPGASPIIAEVQPTASTTPATPKPAAVDVPSFHVTAIIKGARVTAIVERDGRDPIAVSVGSPLDGYRVAAISDDGIVVTGHGSIHTISITQGPSGQDTDQDGQAATHVDSNSRHSTAEQETGNVSQ